ncbi:toxin co-regulated pilus biosynthesis Q family protein [Paraburkholderia tropica]|uniref:toxin co-regulated pilus biosynthesis Q family protein n=1 Tax=Paraburkholderia tropica TaxID=92647 RepID=UPI002AB60109|nr:toxin co-regulated pilus biosynthesis Q family protein [Paraburkholderia tropica]
MSTLKTLSAARLAAALNGVCPVCRDFLAYVQILVLSLVCVPPVASAALINVAPPDGSISVASASKTVAVAPPSNAVLVLPYGIAAPEVARPASVASDAGTGDTQLLTQTGVRPASVYVVRGHGHDVALNRMMRALLPRGFTVDYGDVLPTRPVSWQGNVPWDDVLAHALASLGDVSGDIDWTQRHVTLAHIDVPPGGAPAVPVAAAAIAASAAASSSPASGPHAPASYDLAAGESLESQLGDWARRAGWSVTWNTSDDWIVPHASSFGPDFEKAITQVITQMEANGADVRGDIWTGNRTVVIDRAGVN